MDTHQKISIAVFGILLLGTLAMYGSGGLSSSVLKSDALQTAGGPCPSSYMTSYVKTYPTDRAKMIEIQRFLGINCGKDIVEAKKPYCDAYTKQLATYSVLVKKYEACLKTTPAVTTTTEPAE